MSDERPVEDVTAALARMQKEMDDLKSTAMARANRSPTGSVEPTIRVTAPAETLFLRGQIVSRATYAVLWQWVNDNGLLMPGLFGPADGSTTFGLPNMSGRVPIGVGTLGADTYALGQEVGAASRVLALANMPAHDHGGVNSAGSHWHAQNFNTGGGGTHGGHHFTWGYIISNGAGDLAYVPNANNADDAGNHSHHVGGDTGTTGSHTHTLDSAGSGTAFDNRQASIAVNWLIWT